MIFLKSFSCKAYFSVPDEMNHYMNVSEKDKKFNDGCGSFGAKDARVEAHCQSWRWPERPFRFASISSAG